MKNLEYAFPGEQGRTPEGTWNQTWEPGMSLRDYFAAKAMAALIEVHSIGTHFNGSADVARAAYQCADAMLKERERENSRG